MNPPFLRVLGTADLLHADGRRAQSVLAQRKRFGFLAYLVVESRSEPVDRGVLAEVFWPSADPKRANGSLRTYMHGLRRAFGADAIMSEGRSVWVPPDRFRCDVHERLDAWAQGRLEPEDGPHGLRFLPGFHIPDCPAFDHWTDAWNERVRAAAVAAWLAASKERAEAGEWREGAGLIARARALRPLDEEMARRHMRALGMAGRRAEALRIYDDLEAALLADLDAAPAEATRRLVQEVGSGSLAAGVEPASVPPSEATDPAATGEPTTTSSAEPVRAAPDEPAPASTRETPAARTRTRPARRRLRLAAGAGALLMAAMLTAMFLPSSGGRDDGLRLVLVPPPSVEEGAPDWLGPGVLSLTVLAFEQVGAVRVIDPSVVLSTVEVYGEEADLVERFEPDLVVGGRVAASTGDSVEVALTLGRPGAWRPGRATLAGAFTDLPRLTGEVVAALAASLNEGDDGVDIRTLLTADPHALEAFVAAEAHFRQGRYGNAVAEYGRALFIDSTFAWALYRRSAAGAWIGADSVRHWADLSLVHSYRLTSRQRRVLDAWRSFVWGNVVQAEEAYTSLASEGAPDAEILGRLGELQYHWGPLLGFSPERAKRSFEGVLELSPDDAAALHHLARLVARDGQLERLRRLTVIQREIGIDRRDLLELEVLEAILAGRPVDGARLAELASEGWEIELHLLSSIIASLPRPGEAVDMIRRLPPPTPLDWELRAYDSDRPLILRHWLLTSLLWGVGRRDEARIELDRLREIHLQRALELETNLVLSDPANFDPVRARELLSGLTSIEDHPAWRRGEYEPGPPAGAQTVYDVARPGLYPPRRAFLEGLLVLALDPSIGTRSEYADSLRQAGLGPTEYMTVLHAWQEHWAGNPAAALARLGSPAASYNGARPRAVEYRFGLARWLRIEALVALGRDEEALHWTRGFPDPGAYDLPFIGQARLTEARILERLGRSDEAAAAYSSALAVLEGATGSGARMLDETRAGLLRTRR